MPRSSRKARIWLMMPVRWLTKRSRTRRSACKSVDRLFGGDELNGSALDSFGDCFSAAEIVRLPFAIRFECFAGMSRALWPSECSLRLRWWAPTQASMPIDLAARPSLAHDDGTTLIQAHNAKRILVDIDALGGNW
jgi:hypothetical protein